MQSSLFVCLFTTSNRVGAIKKDISTQARLYFAFFVTVFLMATLLILDASSAQCSVSLLYNGDAYHMAEQQPRKHAQRLLAMVDELLANVGVRQSQIDGIAFGRGPGSFTGLRIAAATAQGIAMGLEKPVYGASSLVAMAHGYMRATPDTHAWPKTVFTVLNAHMGEVFWSAYALPEHPSEGLRVLHDECVTPPEVFLAQWQETSSSKAVVGDGLLLDACAHIESEHKNLMPLAQDMQSIVLSAWEGGEFGDPDQHPPKYLRDSVAWKKLSEQPTLLNPHPHNTH